MGKSPLRLLRNATFAVIMLTLIGRLTGFIREQVIAYQFGTSTTADMYITAFTIPQYISNILGGMITVCFIPLFIDYHSKEGSVKSKAFANNFFKILCMILIFYSLFSFLGSSIITELMNFGRSKSEALFIFNLMVPVTIFMTFSLFFSAYANANKSFIIPSLAPIIMSGSFILIIMFLPGSLNGLAWSSLISVLLQYLFIHFYSKKIGFGMVLRWEKDAWDTKLVLRIAVPMLIGSLFIQSFAITDKIIAQTLPEGSIAALGYAYKLTQLPLGIFATAIATLIFPTLSLLASKGDIPALKESFGKGIAITLLITWPAVIIMMTYAEPITRILFERGKFDSDATLMTANAVVLYSIGVIGASLTMIISRVFYASRQTSVPVVSNIITALINLALSIIFVKSYGYIGLALANGVSATLNFVILFCVYVKRYKVQISLKNSLPFAKILVVASVTYFTGLLISFYLDNSVVGIAVGSGAITVIYGLMAIIVKQKEMIVLKEKLTELFSRIRSVSIKRQRRPGGLN